MDTLTSSAELRVFAATLKAGARPVRIAWRGGRSFGPCCLDAQIGPMSASGPNRGNSLKVVFCCFSSGAFRNGVITHSHFLGRRFCVITPNFRARFFAASDQGVEDCLERGFAPLSLAVVDGCAHISLGLGGPHGAVAVGNFSLDHAGPQLSLRAVVGGLDFAGINRKRSKA